MLALGWLSVEDEHGAQKHPYKVRETKSGESLSPELAESLLRDILRTYKGVTQEDQLVAWVDDCILALTAHIRTDAAIVNRAAVFAEWQKNVASDGADMPDQARRILFTMCGNGFVSLTLPDEISARADEDISESGEETESDSAADPKSKTEDEDAVEPSNSSRGVFGDLFGGDAGEKLSRAAGKDEFAANVRMCLVELGDVPPTREIITTFRAAENLPELDISDPKKYPVEVSSSGAPTAVAKRYRKLLVCLGLWPKSDAEDGVPRTQAVASFGKRVAVRNENEAHAQINGWDLVEACPKPPGSGDASKVAPSSQRVFTPSWANDLAKRVAAATRMPAEAKSFNEFKRLMFALAARRISQTQSWTKLNEIERHKAAVKEDAARERLQEIDKDGRARAWLIEYEQKRAERSSALSGFQITKRMIGECDSVFSSWQKSKSAEEREEQTALVQAEAEKFGDPAFYTDLSTDPNAEVIWRHLQGVDILNEWVKFRNAQYDQQRRKIPRFCHPDSFRHPTWCEFGGSSKPKVWYAWNEAIRPQKPEPGGNADGSRQLWLLLPDFESKQAKAIPMRWRNKRLSKDLGQASDIQEHPIPRADRLGLAAAKLPVQDEQGNPIRYRPQFPFSSEAKGWNARLQICRDSLVKLEHQWDHERGTWKDAGKALRSARWFVTFAPALAISDGPGRQIHAKLGWLSNPHSEQNKKQKRGLHAQLILCRLPGLRILSVDLGHRFSAACAVWETLSNDQLLHEIKEHELLVGGKSESDMYLHTRHADAKTGKVKTTIYRRIGPASLQDGKSHPAPWARLDRQFLIKLPGEDKPARAASREEIALVAKLAEDLGQSIEEDHDKGRAVDQLMSRAVRIATLGLKRHARRAKIAYALDPNTKNIPGIGGSEKEFTPGDEEHIKFLVNALFDWHALASELKWNDPVALILWNKHITSLDESLRLGKPFCPEAGSVEKTRPQRRKEDDELRGKLKPIALQLCQADRSAMHHNWCDRWRNDDGYAALVEKSPLQFMQSKVVTPATGWHARLRLLSDWIMGRRLSGIDGSNGWKQNVGGLSLTRIATMKSLYQLQKAFAMRSKHDRPGAAVKEGESNKGLAQSILNAMEEMREQRVKQIASHIAAGAFGLAGHWKVVETKRKNADGTPQTKSIWVEEQIPRFKSCHAIVIEDLTNYRPEETQSRRENRQLMSWSSSKVKKYLSEACQLHGLHLREVQAGYTSRQDSRTGAPGVRCADVSVRDFLSKPWWKRQVKISAEKVKHGKGDARERFLADLHAKWSAVNEAEHNTAPPLRIPVNSGELFVSADPRSPAAKGLQADLNAAANIGLKALMDPDWTGKWWYVPASLNSDGYRVPAPKSCAGVSWIRNWKVGQSQHGYTPNGKPHQLTDDDGVKKADEILKQTKASFDNAGKLLKIARKARGEAQINAAAALVEERKIAHDDARKALASAKKGVSAKEVINLWRDLVSAEPECFASGDSWREYACYKQQVEYRVINNVLRSRARLEPDLHVE